MICVYMSLHKLFTFKLTKKSRKMIYQTKETETKSKMTEKEREKNVYEDW